MRTPVVLVAAGLFVCTFADARKPKRDPRVAFVDDEPMSLRVLEATRLPSSRSEAGRGLDDAVLRGASAMRGPEVKSKRINTGPLSEGRFEAPRTGNEDKPVSGAVEELIARQMRRHQPSIDACAQEAAARRPTESGTVLLRVVVSEKKVAAVHVAEDSVRDIDFDLCLVKAGKSWRFDLHQAAFNWPVTLSPTAQR